MNDSNAQYADDNPNILQLINNSTNEDSTEKLLEDWKQLTIRLLKLDNQTSNLTTLLTERLQLGLQRYGHGVQVNADTRAWGTKNNSWLEMAQEEALDGLVYLSAHIFRTKKSS